MPSASATLVLYKYQAQLMMTDIGNREGMGRIYGRIMAILSRQPRAGCFSTLLAHFLVLFCSSFKP